MSKTVGNQKEKRAKNITVIFVYNLLYITASNITEMILTKDMQDLNGETPIKYWKDINKDLDKWRAILCSWVEIQYNKDVSSLKNWSMD